MQNGRYQFALFPRVFERCGNSVNDPNGVKLGFVRIAHRLARTQLILIGAPLSHGFITQPMAVFKFPTKKA